MQLIGASLVFVCDKDFTIIKNGGVVFESGRILSVGEYKELESKLESSEDFYADFSKLYNRGERGTGSGYKWDFKKEQMIEVKTREEVVALFYTKMGIDKKSIKKSLKGK